MPAWLDSGEGCYLGLKMVVLVLHIAGGSWSVNKHTTFIMRDTSHD